METSVLVAIAAGISLGIVIAYRAGKAMLPVVAGPFARSPLVISFAVIGCIFVLIPAVMVSLLVGGRLGAGEGGAPSADLLFWVALGIAVVIATSLAMGAFAGMLSARLIEQMRVNMKR